MYKLWQQSNKNTLIIYNKVTGQITNNSRSPRNTRHFLAGRNKTKINYKTSEYVKQSDSKSDNKDGGIFQDVKRR
jgi:hypothetical protein